MSQITHAKAALVLFSGGQDSTTCLAWALARFAGVETVGFDYGQRHRVEMECRPRIAARTCGSIRLPPCIVRTLQQLMNGRTPSAR